MALDEKLVCVAMMLGLTGYVFAVLFLMGVL